MKYQALMAVTIIMALSGNLPGVMEWTTYSSESYNGQDAYVDDVQNDSTFNTDTLQIQGFNHIDPDPFPDSEVESVQQSFLQFDVSWLEEKTVIGAYFGIYLNAYSEYASPSMQLHYVSNDLWDEDTITWDTKPASSDLIGSPEQVSEDNLDNYYEWTIFKEGSGFDDYWNNSDITDGFVSYMLTAGAENINNYAYFTSGNSSTNQPYLRIEYIPEPATVVLLGLGAALIRGKKLVRRS